MRPNLNTYRTVARTLVRGLLSGAIVLPSESPEGQEPIGNESGQDADVETSGREIGPKRLEIKVSGNHDEAEQALRRR